MKNINSHNGNEFVQGLLHISSVQVAAQISDDLSAKDKMMIRNSLSRQLEQALDSILLKRSSGIS